MTMYDAQPQWIEVDGAANVRDLAGTTTSDGLEVRPGRLVRSDNLQDLTAADVRRLVDEVGVRAVADLRTGVELANEGAGPMTREPAVEIVHLSLFPESGQTTDVAASDEPVVLPWQDRDNSSDHASDGPEDERRRGTSGVYLRYLDDRPDSIVGALRLIASTDGAVIVHCAAGKDRTGVVVAFALEEIGVPRDQIVADYARSAERVAAVIARMSGRQTGRRTYTADLDENDIDRHKPRAVTMERFLNSVDELYGGVRTWLHSNGWTDTDVAALRGHLLDA